MNKTLTKVCEYLNNYFWRKKVSGKFIISEGALDVPSLQLKSGMYFRILGSDLNDGVYVYPPKAGELKDEEFTGAVWSMVVPQTVIDLVTDIENWEKIYGGVDSPANSPYNSESFGNYSYSKGSASSSAVANGNTWQAVFGTRLAPFRRLRGLQ